jgi:hypothetical protein
MAEKILAYACPISRRAKLKKNFIGGESPPPQP